MNDFIQRKQHALNAILKKQCYVKEIKVNGHIVAEGTLDCKTFKETVYVNLFESLNFLEIKNENAVLLDSGIFWFRLSHPYDPDILVKIEIYDNTDNTYFLDVSFR